MAEDSGQVRRPPPRVHLVHAHGRLRVKICSASPAVKVDVVGGGIVVLPIVASAGRANDCACCSVKGPMNKFLNDSGKNDPMAGTPLPAPPPHDPPPRHQIPTRGARFAAFLHARPSLLCTSRRRAPPVDGHRSDPELRKGASLLWSNRGPTPTVGRRQAHASLSVAGMGASLN